MNSAFRNALAVAAFSAAVAGCFNEPEPAYKTVPEGARVYLSDKGLSDLRGQPLDASVVDYLNLDRNQLTNVDEVASLSGLKWLRLNDNRLSSLPDLSKLVNLRRVYLRGNRFSEIPETLKDLPSLDSIDISGNPVREVPKWLAEKGGLKALSFTRTMLVKLPDDLSAWKSLQSLQLGELGLSKGEMARIRKALPSVAVVF
jgi:Leucine-rich repeat (LRR) protein